MPRLPIGPANNAPPLHCERLEDRSLLSSSTLNGTLGDLVYAEPLPCEELPADGVVLEEGQTAILYDESLSTLEWIEESDEFISDELYFEDELYYEDECYYEEETYYDEDWYYEEEYWDDSWYTDEVYYEESWDGEDELVDAGGMTWDEYEEVWLEWDRGIEIPEPAPWKDGSEWSWTLADVGQLTDLNDGMVYAMAISRGIEIPDAPATTADTPTVDLLPLPVSTDEADSGLEVSPALPPVATPIDLAAPTDVAVLPDEESGELPATAPTEDGEAASTAVPALAAPSDTDDHLTEAESLELSEDLPVG